MKETGEKAEPKTIVSQASSLPLQAVTKAHHLGLTLSSGLSEEGKGYFLPCILFA